MEQLQSLWSSLADHPYVTAGVAVTAGTLLAVRAVRSGNFTVGPRVHALLLLLLGNTWCS